jgi:hypothetical protein
MNGLLSLRAFRRSVVQFLTFSVFGVMTLKARGEEPGPVDATSGSGVNIHFTEARPGELEMLKAAGFKWVRMDFMWQGTEREKGVYDFSAYDRLMGSLAKQGIKAYFILDYSNPLYEPQASVRSEEGRKAYTQWALAAVEHFKGRGICWEIWNEPNGGFWPPAANAAEFVEMAAMASKAIHAAYPEEVLVGPATSTIDMAFLEACFKAGLLESWSAVSVHPYRQGGPESVDADYYALRNLIAKYAPEGKRVPVLSGEWGYSSAWEHFDPALQGRMLPREWLMNAANGVPLSIWYDWKDDGPDPKESEHHFGTVEAPYHEGRDPVFDPKPAYVAAKTYNTVLKGCRFLKRISLGSMAHRGMLFEGEEGRLVLAAWTDALSDSPVWVPSDDGEFPVTGHVGKVMPKVSARAGRLDFKVSRAVQYFVFEKGNGRLAAAQEALAMEAQLIPAAGGEVRVEVKNLSGRSFEAKVELVGAMGIAIGETGREIAVPAEPAAQTVVFPLKQAPGESYRLGAQVEVNGAVVAEVRPRLFFPPDEAALRGAQVGGEGDPEIGGAFAVSNADAPEEPPSGVGETMRLDYEFPNGWKYAAVHPGQEAEKMLGGDKSPPWATFGMWIYGNSSNLSPRLRVADAAGRTWQPSMPEINWKGWKYVECTVDADTAHWGGAEAEKRRGPVFPLKWDALFLLDNPPRTAAKGEIYFTMPAVIWE